MPNSVAKRRSRIAILAVVSVLASLFVLPMASASAATGDVEKAADFSACVSGATADAGFADTAGSFADASIDCIKYYGITTGTTATTYSPGQVVTRWQMALFLIRAAGPAGITVPAATSQGFTDISGFPQATQDAINQLAALGISKGTSTTTYSPNDAVSRYQMALFLVRFLAKAGVTFDGTSASGFTDTGAVSFEAFNAIEDAYDFGITKGTTATTYAPFAAVTREQMAAFIARTLGHTNARPAGVTVQAKPTSGFGAVTPTVKISYRDAAFKAVANQLIDVFSKTVATGTTLAAPFKTDGTCNGTQTGDCTLSLADNATDGNGNITLTPTVAAGNTTQWWAWTGTTGATFDNDTTASGTVTVVSSAAATGYKVTTTLPKNASTTATAGTDTLVKFGTSVTITVQLVDAANKAVARADQNVIFTNTVWGNDSETGGAVSVNSTTVKTDATGKATLTVTQADPTAGVGNDADFDQDIAITGVFTGTTVELEWSDNAAVVSKLVLSQDAAYTLASSDSVGAGHVAKGEVYDQYGVGMNGINVQFSNLDELSTPVVRTTVNGVATIGWNRDDATAEADTLSGIADVDADGDYADGGAGGAIADSGDLNVYWVVEEADAGSSAADTAVLVADGANGAIVYDAASPTIAYYDANDQFKVGGAAKSFADFDTAVKADAGTSDTITVTSYAADPTGISQFDYTPTP